MLYLMFLIFMQICVLYTMRFSNIYGKNKYFVFLISYIVSTFISYLIIGNIEITEVFANYYFESVLAIYNGILMVAGLTLITWSIEYNTTSTTTLFNRMGIIIPIFLSIIVFKKSPKLLGYIGILLALIGIIFLYTAPDKKFYGKASILLILVFFIGGLIDFNSKLYDKLGCKNIINNYIFLTFLTCIILSLILMLKFNRKVLMSDIICGFLIGIPNILVLYLTMETLKFLPAFLVFPTVSASVILICNLIDYLFLKKKFTNSEKVATILIAISIILINL